MTKVEEWRSIPDIVGYEVSSLGRVRSLPRIVTGRNSVTGADMSRFADGRILAIGKTNRGHLTVRTNTTGRKSKHRYIHHLVMAAFGPPQPFAEAIIRHLDDDKGHNLIGNLAWGTISDNATDSRSNGTMPLGERRPNAKLNADKARYIRESVANGAPRVDLAREFDVDLKTIYQVTSGKTWSHAARAPRQAVEAIGRLK